MLFALLAIAVSPVDQAQDYFRSISQYREAVEFQHVRVVDGAVCGEINRPWGGEMSGFKPFVYFDRRRSASETPDGLSARINNRSDNDEYFRNQIRWAQDRNDAVGVRVWTERHEAFTAAAREMLATCR